MVGLVDLQRLGHFNHWAQPHSAVYRSTCQGESSDYTISHGSCQSSPEDIRKNDRGKNKSSYARHYDRRQGARSLASLLPGDEVRLKTPQHNDWSQKGVVSTPADTPRSIVVQTPSDGVYRGNRRQLQATDASSESTIPSIDVEPSVEPGVITSSPTELPNLSSSLSPARITVNKFHINLHCKCNPP